MLIQEQHSLESVQIEVINQAHAGLWVMDRPADQWWGTTVVGMSALRMGMLS